MNCLYRIINGLIDAPSVVKYLLFAKKKSQRKKITLCYCFEDLSKVFDTIQHEKILQAVENKYISKHIKTRKIINK